jgi:hypothetical protein
MTTDLNPALDMVKSMFFHVEFSCADRDPLMSGTC